MLLQQIVSGLISGGAYSLVAVGLVMIYKATKTFSFVQGEFFMLGAYGAYLFHVTLGFNYLIAFAIAVFAVGILGLLCERVGCRPIIKAPHISILISTVGLSFMLKGLTRLLAGSEERPFPPIMSNKPINMYGLIVTPQQMVVVAFTFFFLILLLIFFAFTKLGKSMRAVCSNQDAASLMGISVKRVFSITWVLSALVGAIGGVLLAPLIVAYPDMGVILIKAFAAGAIGGFLSVTGAVVGGFIVGLMENLAGGYLKSEFAEVMAFWIIIVILIFKPTGLFGKREMKKV